MTRMRNLVLGSLAALAIGGAASSASAMETGTFQNRLNGATIGLPLGALPPPGLYTGLETAYLGTVGSSGASTGNAAGGAHLFLPAIAQAVPLLWVPGWNFLGASYGMSAVVAFYNANNCGTAPCMLGNGPNTIVGGSYVFANPTWNPISLSWNLGGGWFVSAGFNFMAPIGTHTTGTTNPDYWTLEPTFAVAYLANSWNLAANFFYDINTASQGHCCAVAPITSGDALYIDFHALYKFGKWSVGPVGYTEIQTTSIAVAVRRLRAYRCAASIPASPSAAWLVTTSVLSIFNFGSRTTLREPTLLKAPVASTSGAAWASGSGDRKLRTRWLPRTNDSLIIANGPAGNSAGLFCCL